MASGYWCCTARVRTVSRDHIRTGIFGYLASADTNVAALHTQLSDVVGTDAVNLVDLATANALSRFRVARDGAALFEAEPGTFLEFRETATRFWCDVEPVLRGAHADVLAAL